MMKLPRIRLNLRFRSMTLASLTSVVLILLVLLVVAIGVTGWYTSRQVAETWDDYIERIVRGERVSAEMEALLLRVLAGIDSVAQGTTKNIDPIIADIERLRALTVERESIAQDESVRGAMAQMRTHLSELEVQVRNMSIVATEIMLQQAAILARARHLSATHEAKTVMDLTQRMTEDYDRRIEQVIGQSELVSRALMIGGTVLGLLLALILRRRIRLLARSLKGAGDELAGQSEDAAAASEQMSSSAQQVKAAMHQAEEAVRMVHKSSGQTAASMQQVTESINEISRVVEQLASKAQESLRSGQETLELIQKSNSEIDDGRKVLQEGAAAMDELEEHIRNINSISDSIMKITEQTNLLALNAAIEAARAGEHGRGFAVVADEVRKLAEESTQATERIQAILRGVQEATRGVIHIMVGGQETNGLRQGRSIIEVFDAVAQVSATVETAMRAVVVSAEDQAAATEQAGASSQEISSAAEEVFAQAEEASSATQRMSESVRQVMAAIDQLVLSIDQLAGRAQRQTELAAHLQEENRKLA